MNPKWKKVGWILLHVVLFIPFALVIQGISKKESGLPFPYPINFYCSLAISVVIGLMMRKHKGAPLAFMCLASCLHINTLLLRLGAPAEAAGFFTLIVSIVIAGLSLSLILAYGKKHDIMTAKKMRQAREQRADSG